MYSIRFENAKKILQGLGGILAIIGVYMLVALENEAEDFTLGSILIVVLCVITGLSLFIKPTFLVGLAASVSAIILGIYEIDLADYDIVPVFFPIIDFIAAAALCYFSFLYKNSKTKTIEN